MEPVYESNAAEAVARLRVQIREQYDAAMQYMTKARELEDLADNIERQMAAADDEPQE